MDITCSLDVSPGVKYSPNEFLYNIKMSDENNKKYVVLLQTITEQYFSSPITIELDTFDIIYKKIEDKLRTVVKLIIDSELDKGCSCEPARSFTGEIEYDTYESAVDISISLSNGRQSLKASYNISTNNNDFITKLTDLCEESTKEIGKSHIGVLYWENSLFLNL